MLDAIPVWFPLTVATLFGLVIGSFLNVVVYRVPLGLSLMPRSACPQCDAPITAWQNIPIVSYIALRGRCHNCHQPISPQYPLVEAFTGAAFLAVDSWWLQAWPLLTPVAWWAILLALLLFASAGIALGLIDTRTKLLPDVIVLPTTAAAAVLLSIAAAATGVPGWDALLRAVIGALLLGGLYALLVALPPHGMGFGDVKLALLLGLLTGWFGWAQWVVGAFAAFLYGGILGTVLLLAKKAGRKTAIPFGPWMLIGAWTGIFFGAPLATAYLTMSGIS